MALDPQRQRIYLATAKCGPKAASNRRQAESEATRRSRLLQDADICTLSRASDKCHLERFCPMSLSRELCPVRGQLRDLSLK